MHFVFGVVRDKDIRGIGNAIFPVATSIHLTPLVNTRSAAPAEVAAMHKRYAPRMKTHSIMREALRAAWKECSASGLVVVTGSLYLVGELLLFVQANSPPPKKILARISREGHSEAIGCRLQVSSCRLKPATWNL